MSGSSEVIFDMDWAEVPPEPSPPAEPPPTSIVVVGSGAPHVTIVPSSIATEFSGQNGSVDHISPPSVPAPPPLPPLSNSTEKSPPSSPPPPLPLSAPYATPLGPSPAISTPPKALVRGQRADLTKLGLSEADTVLALRLDHGPAPIQMLCAGLGAAETVFGSGYFVNSREVKFPCGSATMLGPANGDQRLRFDLSRAPSGLHRILVAAASDIPGTKAPISGTLAFQTAGNNVAEYAFNSVNCDSAGSVFLAEVYLRQGYWRLYIPGESVPSELTNLVKRFGL